MNKNVKYLIENIINFNPADYNDEESDIIGNDDIYKTLNIPKTLSELKKIIKEKIKENPTKPYLKDIDTQLIKTMNGLFKGPEFKDIEVLDLSTWDTSNVTNMHEMFCKLYKLKELKLSKKFDTSKVKDMSYMFGGCIFSDIDVSNFNTSNVTDMSYMFCTCDMLSELDLSNFNTFKVENMSGMFFGCEALRKLNVSNFNTSNVTDLYSTFEMCNMLKELDLSNWNISKVTDVDCLFNDCYALQDLDLSGWNISHIKEIISMFNNCDLLNIERLKTTDPKIKNQFEKDRYGY